jgi:Family of unknown function (DUF6510)
MTTEQFDYQDGNMLAGPLSEIFAVDVTAASSQCVHCGRTGIVAELRVYGRGPGLVARCPRCDGVMLRVVRTPTQLWLDLTGTTGLRIPMPD